MWDSGRRVTVCRQVACVVSSVWLQCIFTQEQGDSAGSYHVRVGLQHKASLFPPLLSVVVLKHITQTLKEQIRALNGWKDGQLAPVDKDGAGQIAISRVEIFWTQEKYVWKVILWWIWGLFVAIFSHFIIIFSNFCSNQLIVIGFKSSQDHMHKV